jgi:AraC-like DNA-binding protein
VQRKTRGRAVRYSFLVGLLHSLLHAGLSRRTALTISRKLKFSSDNTSKLPTIRLLQGNRTPILVVQRGEVSFLQMWQTIRSSIFDRHSHGQAYAAIVISGGYEEAGDHGRFKVEAGNVVLHERFEAHINRFSGSGAVVLNIALPREASFLPGLATVADADLIVRLAQTNRVQAARLLLSTIAQREAEHADWPDELASALIANPSLSLSRWSESNRLTPWGVSRGFMQVFGLSPSAFRVRTRARKAWKAIQSDKAPLAAIASDLGFADQPHMTRGVKQLTGMGPQAWRKAANGFKTERGTAI